MSTKILTLVLVVASFILGFFLRGLLPLDGRLPIRYGCNQIARWHSDYLIREYGVEFNTDGDNPRREINQKAGELNGNLLDICNTDPTKF